MHSLQNFAKARGRKCSHYSTQNHYQENSDLIKMKCSECCDRKKHDSGCSFSGNCKLKNSSTRKVLVRGPDFLILQIDRFATIDGKKIDTTVWPNDWLILSTGEEYELLSLAHHLGETANNGHYLASVKSGDIWLRCDDTSVELSSESNAKSTESYICVYTKVSEEPALFTRTK